EMTLAPWMGILLPALALLAPTLARRGADMTRAVPLWQFFDGTTGRAAVLAALRDVAPSSLGVGAQPQSRNGTPGAPRVVQLARLDDPEALDLLDHRQARPAIDIVKDDQLAEVAADLDIDAVDGLELLPDAAGGVVER